MQWTVFSKAAAALRQQGSVPTSDPLGRGRTLGATVIDRSLRTILLSMALGAVAAMAVGSLSIQLTGRWIARPEARSLFAAVHTTGVDISRLTTADLTARLQMPSDEMAVVVDLERRGELPAVRYIAQWIMALPKQSREKFVPNLAQLASNVGEDDNRYAISVILGNLDKEEAESIRNLLVARRSFFAKVARIPQTTSVAIMDADFPIRPLDESRARLWRVINAPDFPAGDLVRPLAEVATANPARLEAVRRWAMTREPLPSCAPAPCYDPRSLCRVGERLYCQRDR